MVSIKIFKIILASFFLMGVSVSSQSVFASPQVRLVQELHKNESSMGLAVSGKYIFSGVTRMTEGESHHLAIFNTGDLSAKATLDLPHTVMQILPLSETSVLVLGSVFEPESQSKLSEVSWATGRFVVKTKSLPLEIIPYQMYLGAGRLFFAEPPSQGVFSWSGSSLNRFNGNISGPGAMAASGDNFWVLSRGNLFEIGDERISVGTLSSRAVQYSSISPDDTRGLVDLKPVANSKFILGTNIWKQKIVTFNPKTQEKFGELSVDHSPSATEVFGSCAATIDNNLKTIVISKVHEDGSMTPVTKLDISEAGDRLKSPKTMVFNVPQKQIFFKSAYPCPSCSVSQSSVFAFEDQEATWWDECN